MIMRIPGKPHFRKIHGVWTVCHDMTASADRVERAVNWLRERLSIKPLDLRYNERRNPL